MLIAMYGATGMVGSRILNELLTRGHRVKAVVRDGTSVAARVSLTTVGGDIFDAANVAAVVTGAEAVLSAYGPGPANPEALVKATHSLIEGVKASGVRRLLAVGGAGSLEIAPGVKLIDAPFFPAEWKGIAQAHADALEILRQSGLDWTSLSPAAMIEPGERTGKFRLGTDQLITDASGNSKISAEDFAVAMVDELEKGHHIQQRFCVAY